jgi:hypothetical protein
MWIVKGVLLGLGIFVVGLIIYVTAKIQHGGTAHSGFWMVSIAELPVAGWFVAALVIGVVIVRWRSHRRRL